MKHCPYLLPSSPDRWDAWEQSYQAEREIDTCTHESGYGPSPMEQLDADLMAFEQDWDAFMQGRLGRFLTWLGNYAFSWEAWAILATLVIVLMGMFGADASGLGDGQ